MRQLLIAVVVLFFASSIALLNVQDSSASFTKSKLISDDIFSQDGSMSNSQINSFLNKFSKSCISPNSGFKAKKPTGYSPSGGFKYGSYVTAGTVIASAAKAYDINPRVLIVTLEKEQSLVTGRNSSTYCNDGNHKYAAAMGYGCPDGGSKYSYTNISLYQRNGSTKTKTGPTCVNAKEKAGFTQQVIRGAWLLKFGQQKSKGNTSWGIVKTNWDNSDDIGTYYGGPMTRGNFKRCGSCNTVYYDGYRTIDGQSVLMSTGGTAALYWYTPHFHGNQLFVNLYESWFGSTKSKPTYKWSLVSKGLYTDSGRTTSLNGATVSPGQKVYLRVKAKNTGNTVWQQSFFKLGTNKPQGGSSPLQSDDWITSGRVDRMLEDSVEPGETATFESSLLAPDNSGTYTQYFKPVAEGITWLNDVGLKFSLTVQGNRDFNVFSNSTKTKLLNNDSINMYAGAKLYVTVSVRNNTGSTWPANTTKIGTTNPTNRTSTFRDDSWLTGGRPAKFTTDTAPNASNSVTFTMTAPDTPGSYSEQFGLLIENQEWIEYNTETINISVRAQPEDRLLSNESITTGQRLISKNGYYKLVLQGDGNLVVYRGKKAIWSSRTNGSKANKLVLQRDGNLVLYKPRRAVWATHTRPQSPDKLVLQNDGNLVLYHIGKAVWATSRP